MHRAAAQDKNWGGDYTSPWVWLNCIDFTSRSTSKKLSNSAMDCGGAQPVVFGVSLPRRMLIAFYHEGELFEFNISKVWTNPHQVFDCPITKEFVGWNLTAWNNKGKIKGHLKCPRETMLNVNYENPDDLTRHNALWNGGYAAGTVTLWRKVGGQHIKVDDFDGDLGGCEYGEHDQ